MAIDDDDDMKVKKWEEVDGWKDYFEKTGKDLFDIIESSIKVAALFLPARLIKQRDRIAQLLFAVQNKDEADNVDVEGGAYNPKNCFEELTIIQRKAVPSDLNAENIEKSIEFHGNLGRTEPEPVPVLNSFELGKHQEVPSTTKSWVGMNKSKLYGEAKVKLQPSFEVSKRKLGERYREIENKRKKTQLIDFKDIPAPKSVDGRNYNRMRPVVHRLA